MRNTVQRLTTVVLLSLMGAAVALFTSSASAVDNSQLSYDQSTSWGIEGIGTTRNFNGYEDSSGFTMDQIGNYVYVGGRFTHVTNGIQSVPQSNLARFDVNTGVFDSSFTPVIPGGNVTDGIVASSAVYGNSLFIGGELGSYNGANRGALAKIDANTGQLVTSFQGRVQAGSSVVRDMVIGNDGWLYVAGAFTTVNDGGTPITDAEGLARFNPDTGALDRSWIPRGLGFGKNSVGSFWGIAKSETSNTVYVSGVRAGATATTGLIGLSGVDGSVTWDSFVGSGESKNEPIYDVVTTKSGKIFAGGTQHSLYVIDEASKNILINHGTSANFTKDDPRKATPDARRSGGDYQSIKISPDGQTIYATCHCWGWHETFTNGLIPWDTGSLDLSLVNATETGWANAVIAYDANTGMRDMSFDPIMSGEGGGWDTLVDSRGCVWSTGGFDSVGLPDERVSARDLVRFCANGIVEPPVEVTTTTIQAEEVTTTAVEVEEVTTTAVEVEEVTTTAVEVEEVTTTAVDTEAPIVVEEPLETTTTVEGEEVTTTAVDVDAPIVVEDTTVTTVSQEATTTTVEQVTVVTAAPETVEVTASTTAPTVTTLLSTSTTAVATVDSATNDTESSVAKPANAVEGSPVYTG